MKKERGECTAKIAWISDEKKKLETNQIKWTNTKIVYLLNKREEEEELQQINLLKLHANSISPSFVYVQTI